MATVESHLFGRNPQLESFGVVLNLRDRVGFWPEPQLPPVLAVSWWFAIGLPKVVKHRSPDACHVGDQRLVFWVALLGGLGQVVLEEPEEGRAVGVAYPHHRRLCAVVGLRCHAQQHPFGSPGGLVSAETFERVERKRKSRAAINGQYHPERFELNEVELLADLVLFGKGVQRVLLDPLAMIAPGHLTWLRPAATATTKFLVL